MSLRDLLALIEAAGAYLSDRERREIGNHVLRLAGQATRADVDLEQQRQERELRRGD